MTPEKILSPKASALSADENVSNRQEWNWHPDFPIGNNPLFDLPWNMSSIWAYHSDTWLKLSEVSFFLYSCYRDTLLAPTFDDCCCR